MCTAWLGKWGILCYLAIPIFSECKWTLWPNPFGISKFIIWNHFWKNRLRLTESWYVIEIIATQVITVAVKNMANTKIFVKTSFMVVVFLQSERGSDFFNYRVTKVFITYWPPIIGIINYEHCTNAHNCICNGWCSHGVTQFGIILQLFYCEVKRDT